MKKENTKPNKKRLKKLEAPEHAPLEVLPLECAGLKDGPLYAGQKRETNQHKLREFGLSCSTIMRQKILDYVK